MYQYWRQTFTFNVGHAKYAAKYQQSIEGLALHIQSTYANGSSIAKMIRELKLVVIDVDDYPTGTEGAHQTSARSTYGNRPSKFKSKSRGCSPRM